MTKVGELVIANSTFQALFGSSIDTIFVMPDALGSAPATQAVLERSYDRSLSNIQTYPILE